MSIHPSVRPSIHPSEPSSAFQRQRMFSAWYRRQASDMTVSWSGATTPVGYPMGISQKSYGILVTDDIYIYNIYIYTHLGNPEVHNFRRQAKITCFLPFRLVFAVWSWDTRALFYSLGERYHHTHVKKKVVVELNVYLNFGKTCCSIVRHARLAKGLATVSAFCFFPSTCIADSPWSTATHDIKVVQSMGAK